ncbi:MAG: hypothetical protein QXK52_07335 [Candidatus Bathyarchaeia archaeon]
MSRPSRVDWKVEATVDRELITDEIAQLLGILKRQRISCIVSASDEDEAINEASKRLENHMGIPSRFVKNLHPKMLR